MFIWEEIILFESQLMLVINIFLCRLYIFSFHTWSSAMQEFVLKCISPIALNFNPLFIECAFHVKKIMMRACFYMSSRIHTLSLSLFVVNFHCELYLSLFISLVLDSTVKFILYQNC